MATLDPSKAAMLACTAYFTQQVTFFMYHYNSHAANPIMLRSTKPQVMRDFFLVPCNYSMKVDGLPKLLNPLPGVYVFSFEDALVNSVAMACVGGPLIQTIGFGHVTAIYSLGAIFSGFAYIFQMQSSRTKKSTDFDCAASSQGAVSALCSVSLLMPNQRVPWTRAVPASIFALAYIGRSVVEEYGWNPFNVAAYHKWFRTSELARKSSSAGENVSGSSFFKRSNIELEEVEQNFFINNHAAAEAAASNGGGVSNSNSYNEWMESAKNTGHIELTNWGSIGGIFLGLIYGSLVLGVKKDFSKMGKFWARMPGGRGGVSSSTTGKCSSKPPTPPSWAK